MAFTSSPEMGKREYLSAYKGRWVLLLLLQKLWVFTRLGILELNCSHLPRGNVIILQALVEWYINDSHILVGSESPGNLGENMKSRHFSTSISVGLCGLLAFQGIMIMRIWEPLYYSIIITKTYLW